MSKSGIFSTRKLATAVLAGALLTITACSSQGGAQSTPGASGGSGGKQYTIAVITHEGPGETFFDRIRAGAEQAAKQHGVTLKYSNDPDVGKQSTLIQNAIDSKVDAIATTMPNPVAIGPSLQKAADAGIPTVAINSGIDQYQKYGAMMFFGSDEGLAGQAAGQRLAQESGGGSGKVLCVVHYAGRPNVRDPLRRREEGRSRTPRTSRSTATTCRRSSRPSSRSWPRTRRSPTSSPSTQASPVLPCRPRRPQAAKRSSSPSTSTRTSSRRSRTRRSSSPIDQQPYLQSYEAVDSLWLYLTNGNVLGGGKPVLTGPAFVDSTNIDAVSKYAANNTR